MSVPTRLTGFSPEAAPTASLAATHPSGSTGAGRPLSAWLAQFDTAALRRVLGATALAELDDLSRESDPELLSNAWLNFAYRQQQAGRLELAASAYRALGDSGLIDAGRALRELAAIQ